MSIESHPGIRQTINEGANTLFGTMQTCEQAYNTMPPLARALHRANVPADRVVKTVLFIVARVTGGLTAENKSRLHNPR